MFSEADAGSAVRQPAKAMIFLTRRRAFEPNEVKQFDLFIVGYNGLLEALFCPRRPDLLKEIYMNSIEQNNQIKLLEFQRSPQEEVLEFPTPPEPRVIHPTGPMDAAILHSLGTDYIELLLDKQEKDLSSFERKILQLRNSTIPPDTIEYPQTYLQRLLDYHKKRIRTIKWNEIYDIGSSCFRWDSEERVSDSIRINYGVAIENSRELKSKLREDTYCLELDDAIDAFFMIPDPDNIYYKTRDTLYYFDSKNGIVSSMYVTCTCPAVIYN